MILATGVDPDEMLCYATYHLGLHFFKCLPKAHLGVTSTQMVKLETVGGECLCSGLSVGALLSTWHCVLFSYDYI